MRILVNGAWRDGFLDHYRHPDEYRLQVRGWLTLERLDDLYFVRPRSVRLLWNYLQDVGPRELVRRVVSRRGERVRNQKVAASGVGVVLEAPQGGAIAPGATVVFLAPAHPPCTERLVLPEALVMEAPELSAQFGGSGVAYLERRSAGRVTDSWWSAIRGWSRHAEVPLAGPWLDEMRSHAVREVAAVDWAAAPHVGGAEASAVEERGRRSTNSGRSDRKRAVLIGYGNYAKVVILPNVRGHLDVVRVHEIDPTQIPSVRGECDWDTAPMPRDGPYDVHLIAGYHVSHAPLATSALAAGAYAVAEKPVATSRTQLDQLVTAIERESRFFACFQKRYHPFNELALRDLGTAPGDAISYHCIVYEVPLPTLHWYRWPSSRSRLLSNGCHWLDHFLFLNGFAAVAHADLAVASEGTVNCTVELVNGASFSMLLTDVGSERIGVQDYIELRAGRTTVRMINGSRYESESSAGILRRSSANKMVSYRRMYRDIAAKISRGEAGDSARATAISGGLVLTLEEAYRARVAPGAQTGNG